MKVSTVPPEQILFLTLTITFSPVYRSNLSSRHGAVRLNTDIKPTLGVQMSIMKLTGDLVASSSLCIWLETLSNNSGSAVSENYRLLGNLYRGLRCFIRFMKPLSCTTLNGWLSSAVNSIIFLVVALDFSVLMSNIGATVEGCCGCCDSAASLL